MSRRGQGHDCLAASLGLLLGRSQVSAGDVDAYISISEDSRDLTYGDSAKQCSQLAPSARTDWNVWTYLRVGAVVVVNLNKQ